MRDRHDGGKILLSSIMDRAMRCLSAFLLACTVIFALLALGCDGGAASGSVGGGSSTPPPPPPPPPPPSGPLAITTTSLPPVVVESPYLLQLQATGGTGNYYWRVIRGTFANGVSMTTSGLISGTPIVTGNWVLRLEVTSGFVKAMRDFVLVV